MSAPCSGIDPLAVIGRPPEHRDYRGRADFNLDMQPFPPMIYPTALIEALAHVDAGCFRHTIIGPGSWIMKGVHVGHDCVVGADVEIAPNSSLGGECVIGDRVKIGQCAVTKPRVRIGSGAVIGAGAVVTKDVPAGEVWVGNPARFLRHAEPVAESPFGAVAESPFGDGCIPIHEPRGELEQRQAAAYMPGGWLNSDPGDEQPE